MVPFHIVVPVPLNPLARPVISASRAPQLKSMVSCTGVVEILGVIDFSERSSNHTVPAGESVANPTLNPSLIAPVYCVPSKYVQSVPVTPVDLQVPAPKKYEPAMTP